MTSIQITNRKLLRLDAQKLLRRVKDRTGVVVHRYIHPHMLHVQLDPSGWGVKVPADCRKVLA